MEILLKIFTYVGYDEKMYANLGANPILCRVFSYIKTTMCSDLFDDEYLLKFHMVGDRFKIFYQMLKFGTYSIVPKIRYYDHQIVAIHNAFQPEDYSTKLSNIHHLVIPMNKECYQDLSNMINLQGVTINSITRCSWGKYEVEYGKLLFGSVMKRDKFQTCLYNKDKECLHYKTPSVLRLPPNISDLRLDDVDFTKLNVDVFEGCINVKKLELHNVYNFGIADVKKLADTTETLVINNSDIVIYGKLPGYSGDGELTMDMAPSKNILTGARMFNNLTEFEYLSTRINTSCRPLINLYDMSPSLEIFRGYGIELIAPVNQKYDLPNLKVFHLTSSHIKTENLEIPESVKRITMRNVEIKHSLILIPRGLTHFSFDNNTSLKNILSNFGQCNSLEYFSYNEKFVKFKTEKVRRVLLNSSQSLKYIEYTRNIMDYLDIRHSASVVMNNNALIKKFFNGRYP